MTMHDDALPPPAVATQFDDLAQQRAAGTLGMWTFLTTETMFFGALLFAYAVARGHFPVAFAAASRHTDLLLGTINTAVLLTSSLCMALAATAASARARIATVGWLVATTLLGLAFCGIKLAEYAIDYREHLVPVLDFAFDPPALAAGAETFFWLYFTTTGLHLVHLVIGIGMVLVLAARAYRARARNLDTTIDAAGLYWHFVDVVWIFLYPLLYLVALA
ncbi:MAG: cytochrome c oxidase subunit 3 [Burkholderiales bacterium]